MSREPTRKTTRVQLELAPVSMDQLKRLKERTGAASYAEVIRNALRKYESDHDEKAVTYEQP